MHLFATQKKNEILVAMHLLRANKGEEFFFFMTK